MSIQTWIYLASISGKVQAICSFLSICFAIGGILLLLLSFDNTHIKTLTNYSKKQFYMRFSGISLTIISVILLVLFALIPNKADIYKLAGINEIQKTNINANGEIIENKTNTNTDRIILSDSIKVMLNTNGKN